MNNEKIMMSDYIEDIDAARKLPSITTTNTNTNNTNTNTNTTTTSIIEGGASNTKDDDSRASANSDKFETWTLLSSKDDKLKLSSSSHSLLGDRIELVKGEGEDEDDEVDDDDDGDGDDDEDDSDEDDEDDDDDDDDDGNSDANSDITKTLIAAVSQILARQGDASLEKKATEVLGLSTIGFDKQQNCNDPQEADDISDGISIISDCESTERISPQPFLPDHFNAPCDDDIDYTRTYSASIMNPPTVPIDLMTTNELRAQLRQHQATATSTAAAAAASSQCAMPGYNEFYGLGNWPPFFPRGLNGMIYLTFGVILLAFIAQTRFHADLNGEQSSKNIADMATKLNELELQNNLMRAEIDIISKQVNYLSTLKDQAMNKQSNHRGGSGPQNGRTERGETSRRHGGGKTFKAWSGNGNSMKPIDITKEDLKRPFLCPSGKYVEFAAMCIERSSDVINEPFADQIGKAVNEAFAQSATYQNIQQVAETLNNLVKDDEEKASESAAESKPATEQKVKNENNGADKPNNVDYNHNTYHQGKKDKKKFHDHSDEEFPEERFYKEHFLKRQKDKEGRRRHIHDQPMNMQTLYELEQYEYDMMKQKYDNSKERHNKHRSDDYNSKERYNKHHKSSASSTSGQHKHSGEKKDKKYGDGKWQEQMMHEREHIRKEQDERQRADKNWYIERGDDREHMRFGEVHYE